MRQSPSRSQMELEEEVLQKRRKISDVSDNSFPSGGQDYHSTTSENLKNNFGNLNLSSENIQSDYVSIPNQQQSSAYNSLSNMMQISQILKNKDKLTQLDDLNNIQEENQIKKGSTRNSSKDTVENNNEQINFQGNNNNMMGNPFGNNFFAQCFPQMYGMPLSFDHIVKNTKIQQQQEQDVEQPNSNQIVDSWQEMLKMMGPFTHNTLMNNNKQFEEYMKNRENEKILQQQQKLEPKEEQEELKTNNFPAFGNHSLNFDDKNLKFEMSNSFMENLSNNSFNNNNNQMNNNNNSSLSNSFSNSSMGNFSGISMGEKMIGNLTESERKEKVERYLEKKKNRKWKNIRYKVRQNLADNRQRSQGRFVKSNNPRFNIDIYDRNLIKSISKDIEKQNNIMENHSCPPDMFQQMKK